MTQERYIRFIINNPDEKVVEFKSPLNMPDFMSVKTDIGFSAESAIYKYVTEIWLKLVLQYGWITQDTYQNGFPVRLDDDDNRWDEIDKFLDNYVTFVNIHTRIVSNRIINFFKTYCTNPPS